MDGLKKLHSVSISNVPTHFIFCKFILHNMKYIFLLYSLKETRWVKGTPIFKVTPVTIWQILTLDFGHQMVKFMVMNDLLPPLWFNINRPFHSEIQLFENFTMTIHGQGHVCGQRSRSQLTLKIQRSRSWSRSNPLVIYEAWISIDMFALCFVAIGPLLVGI